jgi:hypothetical protein
MISKGDLVQMRLPMGNDPQSGNVREMIILGRVRNYCEDEDTYILAPEVISVPKEQVTLIERLPEDFDFEDVSSEMSSTGEKRRREEPPEISDIRFSGNS